jgi:Spy/CpxP family protein refolding chaperone
MRRVHGTILTIGLALLAASPVLAQPPGGRGGRGGAMAMRQPPGAARLLANDKVQEELKLTDDEKAAVKKATDEVSAKYQDEMDKARTAMDRDKMTELRKAENADVEKAVAAVLKPEQAKRLQQIEVQAAGLDAFSRDDVQAALKLTDAQKKDVKGAEDDMQKDAAEVFKDAAGDRTKMAAAAKKVQDLRTDSVEGVVKGLTDDQKKTWKDLTGDKFDVALVAGGPGGFGAGGFGAGGFGRGGRGGAAQIVAALKLTDDQKTKAQDVIKASEEKTRALMAQAREDLLKQMKDVLPDDQYQEFKTQLEQQGQGRGNGGQGRPGRNRTNPNQ